MFLIAYAAVLLIGMTTAIHYAALCGLYRWLPVLRKPKRSKVLVIVFDAFIAHALEIAVYGVTFYTMISYLGVGYLTAVHSISVTDCMYFSAETYTSLGFGDLTPNGPVRLLVGAEALNGLLMIGWSASFLCISMGRFWTWPGNPNAS